MNGVLLIGADVVAALENDLADAGYLTEPVDRAITVDDIAEALLALKQRTPGGLAAIAAGPATAVLLEAATVLPQLDACVLIEPALPTSHPHYARMRVQVQLHRYRGLSAADVDRLRDAARPGCVQIFDWDYDDAPLGDAVAWDRIRDFLTTSLPVIEGV